MMHIYILTDMHDPQMVISVKNLEMLYIQESYMTTSNI
jgi:hypothetical protein